jgi:hypothetical protein
MSWGGFDSENAIGLSAAGVVARDLLGSGTRVSLGGGGGVGTRKGRVGGRAGVQFSW